MKQVRGLLHANSFAAVLVREEHRPAATHVCGLNFIRRGAAGIVTAYVGAMEGISRVLCRSFLRLAAGDVSVLLGELCIPVHIFPRKPVKSLQTILAL